MSSSPDPAGRARPRAMTLFVRYGIGLILILGGIVVLIASPGGFGTEGFSMAVGAGLSVLMLNWLFRLGVSGDRDRQEEEQARAYFDRHGHWPDEEQGAGRPSGPPVNPRRGTRQGR